MSDALTALSKILPYHYFQTVLSASELNLVWLFSLIGVSLIMAAAAWLRFLTKDIRLAGEGSWKIARSSHRRSKVDLV
jgi:hypothetical protein